MSESSLQPLAELRDQFAARHDDLRHLLVTIDSEVYRVPSSWSEYEPGDYSRWGLPPEVCWRQLPGDQQPRPIIGQWYATISPFWRKHTLYGRDGHAFEPFCNLAYRTVRHLRDLLDASYDSERRSLGLPTEPPNWIPHEPWIWWLTAIHSIVRRKDVVPPFAVVQAPAHQHLHQDQSISSDHLASKRALAQGREDVGILSCSILHADVFQCSAWAIDVLMSHITGPVAPAPELAPGEGTAETPTAPLDLVTLDQAAGSVHKSKRTLERYKTDGRLPDPTIEGGGGRADLWDWRTLRPWLEATFRIPLPETFPANRRG